MSHCCVRDPVVAATPQGALREVDDAKAAPSASPRGDVAERYSLKTIDYFPLALKAVYFLFHAVPH